MSRSSKRSGARGVNPYAKSSSAARLDDFDDRSEDKWSDGGGDAAAEFDRPLDDGNGARRSRESRTSTSSVSAEKKTKKPKKVRRRSPSLLSSEEANPIVGLDGAPLLLFNAHHDNTVALSSLKALTASLQASLRLTSSSDPLDKAQLSGVRVLILAGPRKALAAGERAAVEEFLQGGGSVLLMAGEGRYDRSDSTDDYSHLNALTAPYGITVESDSVARTVYAKGFYHPKEALVRNAALAAHLDSFAHAGAGKPPAAMDDDDWEAEADGSSRLSIVYPFGCTLSLQPPAVPLLTSGALSFPSHRALAAFARAGAGQLVVLGSFHLFDDGYLPRQHNAVLLTGLMDILAHGGGRSLTERIDGERAEYGAVTPLPDTASLSSRLRSCLQEPEELPLDFTTLFDTSLFRFDTALIPEAIALYSALHVKHAPLQLIAPQFEVPLPPFLPAIFHPAMRDLPPPALELFDLDEHFSTPEARIAQLTNKATARDLEQYVREVGDVLGISDKLTKDVNAPGSAAVRVLQFVLTKLVGWKKTDLDDAAGTRGGGGGRPAGSRWAGAPGASDVLQLEGMMSGAGLEDAGGAGSTAGSVGSTSRSSRKASNRDSVEMEE